jgi:hypothetical protein
VYEYPREDGGMLYDIGHRRARPCYWRDEMVMMTLFEKEPG